MGGHLAHSEVVEDEEVGADAALSPLVTTQCGEALDVQALSLTFMQLGCF